MKTIMVVDDDAGTLEKVRSLLEKDDFEVITADNSRKALEIIEKDKEKKFGLILIDTPMPGSDKAAFFSMKPGLNTDNDKSELHDFLEKPFTDTQLLDFIKKKL